MSNNKIASWSDVDRLASLTSLEDILLVGNPIYNDYKDQNALSEYRIEVRPLRSRFWFWEICVWTKYEGCG